MNEKPVIIIGGGPAGCVCGAVLAKEGLQDFVV